MRFFLGAFLFGSCSVLLASSSKLTQPVDLPLVIQGKTVGSMKLPAGSEVEVVSINGTNAVIKRGDSVYTIPPSSLPAASSSAVAAASPSATSAAPSPTPTRKTPIDHEDAAETNAPAEKTPQDLSAIQSLPTPITRKADGFEISYNESKVEKIITPPAPLEPSPRAQTWFVDPKGDNLAKGTSNAPFKTIEHALQVAEAGDSIRIRDGVYRELIKPSISGNPDRPIVIQNDLGAKPVISSCDLVQGPWKNEGGGIFSALMSSNLPYSLPRGKTWPAMGFDQIFVDGEPMQEARYPKKIHQDILNHDGADLTLDSEGNASVPSLGNKPDQFFAGAGFLGRLGAGWALQSSRAVSSSGNTIQLDKSTCFPWWPKDTDAKPAKGYGFFYGKKEFLDADGEFFIDRSGSEPRLMIRIPGGKSPDGHLVERKVRHLVLSADSSRHLLFRGLHFTGGALNLGGNDLSIDKCRVTYPCHFLAFNCGYTPDDGNIDGVGICMTGSGNQVRDSVLCKTAGTGIYLAGTNNLVTRCAIFDTDYSGSYGAPIYISGTDNRALFNTIHDSGRDGLKFQGGGHLIAYNKIYNAGRLALDLGCIETWGNDGKDKNGHVTRIAYNWVGGDCCGIYLDNFSRNYLVDHNVIWVHSHQGLALNSPNYGIDVFQNTIIDQKNLAKRTFCSYPTLNPDPSFWYGSHIGFDCRLLNNLTCPSTDLEDAAHGDFMPKGDALSPATTNSLIECTAVDGKYGLPPGYHLGVRDRTAHFNFHYHIVTGHGVTIPGINDWITGKTPDDGAYESGQPPWKPGVDGWAAVVDGIRN
jgi:hypothetical protein